MTTKETPIHREIPTQSLDKIWESRGSNVTSSQPILLPSEWQSGYGLPIAVACRELTFSTEGKGTLKRVAFALFEDRSFKSVGDRLIPIGYIIGKSSTNGTNPPQLICYDNEGLHLMGGGKDYPGLEYDPLFGKLSQWHSETREFRKIYLSALRVGWDQTYEDVRSAKILTLADSGVKDAHNLADMSSSPREKKLSTYQHTNLELGKLLVHLMLFAGQQIGSDNIYLVGPHNNVQRMLQKSGLSTTYTDTGVLPSFVDGNSRANVIIVHGAGK